MKICSILDWLQMLATMVSALISFHWLPIISLTSCCGVSAWSISTSCLGLNLAICFTISLPMLPAEPVIRIVFPRSSSAMASMSMVICLRGSSSSTSTSCSAMFWSKGDMPSHSTSSGIMYSLMPLSVSSLTNSWSAQNSTVAWGDTMMPSMSSCFIRFTKLLSTWKMGKPARYRLHSLSLGLMNPRTIYLDGCRFLTPLAMLTLSAWVP